MYILKSPQKITPAYNPVLYQFGSTFSNILYFRLNVYDSITNSLIITDNAYVTPLNPTGSEYNISDISRNLVKWEIVNNGSLVNGIDDSLREVKLVISEMGYDSVNNQMNSLSAATTSIFSVWNARLNRAEYSGYNYLNYQISPTSSNVTFLTNRPNYTEVNDSTRDYLYFLRTIGTSSGTYSVNISVIGSTGSIINSVTSNITVNTKGMMRLDVSPKTLKALYPSLLVENLNYYTAIRNSSGVEVSERKYFSYKPIPCNQELINILWENQLGGIDSYQFTSPLESLEAERSTIERGIYDYRNGSYIDYEDNIYNQQESIINVNVSSNIKCWTKSLSDDENTWLSELLLSKNVWIELNNGFVYPVSIQETSYTINRRRYIKEPLQSQWTFKIIGDYINRKDYLQG